jgi:hypothetical protein
MSSSTSIIVAFIGLVGVAVGAILNQAVNWRNLRHQNSVGNVRLLGLLREIRFYADRAKNEIDYHSTIGDYGPGWDAVVNKLCERLDAGDNGLDQSAVTTANIAAAACKQTIFASEHHFARDLLIELVNKTITHIEEAQAAIGDPDPMVYFRAV